MCLCAFVCAQASSTTPHGRAVPKARSSKYESRGKKKIPHGEHHVLVVFLNRGEDATTGYLPLGHVTRLLGTARDPHTHQIRMGHMRYFVSIYTTADNAQTTTMRKYLREEAEKTQSNLG
ncbi:hypothetical protein RUM43_001442 [Polyplax serrata]|uniref:Uncharacterized protein n=1 Tax=Polyplax serrata TaxID=468196 RepID=A0AAN8SI28_POLSC